MRSHLAHEWVATNAIGCPKLHQPTSPKRQRHDTYQPRANGVPDECFCSLGQEALGKQPRECATSLPQAGVKPQAQRPNLLSSIAPQTLHGTLHPARIIQSPRGRKHHAGYLKLPALQAARYRAVLPRNLTQPFAGCPIHALAFGA